jgi:YD repeat-containing protein
MGATLRSIDYAYDDIGSIVGQRDAMPGSVQHQAFSYDGLYRLTRFEARQNDAAGAVLRSESYEYDAEGNIRQIGAQKTLAYADAMHPGRVTAIVDAGTPRNIAYDDGGSISAWGELTGIEYDPLDRVARVTRSDGVRLQFANDPQNRRLLKRVAVGPATQSVRYAAHL